MKIWWIGGALLFLIVVFLSGIHGFWMESFFSLILLILLCSTLLPFTKMLFPDPWEARILVFPIGFTVHAVGLSAAGYFLGIDRWTGFGYVLLAVLLWIFLQQKKRFVNPQVNTQWTRNDCLLLFLWLFVALAIVAIPFARVGQETAQGYAYRAYFNADFFRNMAVAGALSHTGIPPDNPYLAGHALHYYWFFHLLDAYWRELLPSFRSDSLMVQFSLFAVIVFVSTLFVALRRFTTSRKTMLFLLPVFAFGGSYEGLYILQWLGERQMEWTEFVNLNVDGILRWNWRAPQIDTLYRALLYAPQHLIALAIFLIALLIWNSERLKENPIRCNTRRFLFYFLIFSSMGFSAFVGATLILGAALILGIRTLFDRKTKWKEVVLSGLLGIVFLFLYFFVFQMFQHGSQEWDLGPDRIILAHFPWYFVLNWGALLILGIAGAFYRSSFLPNRILICYLIACFLLILFVRIVLAGFSDISLKVGHFSHVVLLLLAAGFIDRILTHFPGKSGWLFAFIMVLVLPASITWGMDAWNSSDIKSRRFTTYMEKEDAEVCRWIRTNLPESTVILNYSAKYDDFMQDILPAFAERSVFLGNRIFSRIFQVSEDTVRERANVVSRILQFKSARESWDLARRVGIEYIFVTDVDRQKMAELIEKLGQPYFSLVMQEGNAGLFRVNAQAH
jgi:hypothetical protein